MTWVEEAATDAVSNRAASESRIAELLARRVAVLSAGDLREHGIDVLFVTSDRRGAARATMSTAHMLIVTSGGLGATRVTF